MKFTIYSVKLLGDYFYYFFQTKRISFFGTYFAYLKNETFYESCLLCINSFSYVYILRHSLIFVLKGYALLNK